MGTSRGKLVRYPLEFGSEGSEEEGERQQGQQQAARQVSIAASGKQELQLKGGSHSEAVDCIVSEGGHRVGGWVMLLFNPSGSSFPK